MRRCAAFCCVLLFLTVPPAAAQDRTRAGPDAPSLTVRGSATVDVKPDLARLTLEVVTRGPTLDGVSKAHATHMVQAGAVLDKLKGAGVTVRQGSFNLAQEPLRTLPGTNLRVEPATFRATTSFALEVRSLDKLDADVGVAVNSGLFELSAASYAVDHPGEALDRARRAAVADALAQAETYADAGRVRLDGVRRIVGGDAQPVEGYADLPLRSAVPVGITPPATIPFSDNVTITWSIAPR